MSQGKLWKVVDIDTGFCRVLYRAKNNDDESIFYCLQDEGVNFGGVRLLRCSRDGEPSHEVGLKPGVKAADLMELPAGDCDLARLCRQWIEDHSKGAE